MKFYLWSCRLWSLMMTAGNEAPGQFSTVQFGMVRIGVAWIQVTILCGLLYLALPTLQHAVSLDNPTDVSQKWNFWTGSQSLKKCKADIWITENQAVPLTKNSILMSPKRTLTFKERWSSITVALLTSNLNKRSCSKSVVFVNFHPGTLMSLLLLICTDMSAAKVVLLLRCTGRVCVSNLAANCN